MVTIDFKIDEEELKEDLECDLDTLDSGFFVFTMFMMPVKIIINRIDFLTPPCTWIHLPIMDIASNGLIVIKNLTPNVIKDYELPEGAGKFVFKLLETGKVTIEFRDTKKTIVNYDELLEAFQSFAERVRIFLKKRAPQINEHPYWGPWLRGERD